MILSYYVNDYIVDGAIFTVLAKINLAKINIHAMHEQLALAKFFPHEKYPLYDNYLAPPNIIIIVI